MAYLSLYRRWRPQTFAQVVGQQHVVRTLQNALRTGHVAHAYLFAGPRGTGKTSIARLLAKGLNCVKGVTPEPCGECESCRRIADGTSLDCLEIDGASNRGIDEVRELRERSKFAPQEGPYKIYIIDEVHMLTTEAFNALLKTLEEPPEHVVFVLATTEAHKVPATILSRCQRFDFHRFGEELVAEHLARVCAAEGLQATPGALRLLARHAEGGMRDALSLLEQCVVYAGAEAGAEASASAGPDSSGEDASNAAAGRILDEEMVASVLGLVPGEMIERFYQMLKAGDVAGALGVVEEVFAGGSDIRQFVHAFAVYLREMLLATAGAGPDTALLLRWIDLLADAEVQLRAGASPRFVLDLLVLRLALGRSVQSEPMVVRPEERQEADRRLAELESRIARLEEMLLGRKPNAVASFWEAAELVERQGRGVAARVAPDVSPGSGPPRADSPAQPEVQGQGEPQQQHPGREQSGAQAQGQGRAQGRDFIEPTPAASVSTPATGEGGEDTTCLPGEQLASVWEMILTQVRQRSIQVQALLREARPAVLLGDTLHLVLPAGCAFHKSGLEQPKVLEMLERVVSRALRRVTHLQFHLGELPADLQSRVQLRLAGAKEEVPANVSPSRSPEGPAVQPGLPIEKWEQADALLNHPLVKRALELFGGRVVQVIPGESRPAEKKASPDDNAE